MNSCDMLCGQSVIKNQIPSGYAQHRIWADSLNEAKATNHPTCTTTAYSNRVTRFLMVQYGMGRDSFLTKKKYFFYICSLQ